MRCQGEPVETNLATRISPITLRGVYGLFKSFICFRTSEVVIPLLTYPKNSIFYFWLIVSPLDKITASKAPKLSVEIFNLTSPTFWVVF